MVINSGIHVFWYFFRYTIFADGKVQLIDKMNAGPITMSLLSLLLSCTGASAQSRRDSMDISLGEVVVTGSNRAVSRDLTPYTVSVVNRRQLEATGHLSSERHPWRGIPVGHQQL